MLKRIRKGMRFIIWATAILFMLALLLGYGAQYLQQRKIKQAIATVGKDEIPLDEFYESYNRMFNNTVESGEEVTEKEFNRKLKSIDTTAIKGKVLEVFK